MHLLVDCVSAQPILRPRLVVNGKSHKERNVFGLVLAGSHT